MRRRSRAGASSNRRRRKAVTSQRASGVKQLRARFRGPDGARRLRDLLKRQALTESKVDVVEQLALASTVEAYDSDETIIEQDGTDTDIFFILSGAVTVSPNDRPDTTRSAGTHVGEMAAIDPSARRSARVYAREPTVVARVSEPALTSVANAHPFIWRHLAREMCDRLRQRVAKVPARKSKPRLFIASSKEGLVIAKAFKAALPSDAADIVLWTKGIFTPGSTNIEALEAELLRADFALIVLSPDDKVISRGTTSNAPRDNLILELGLFVGAIGRRRALMAFPRGLNLKLPTDLLGVNPVMYSPSKIAAAAKTIALDH
jgi:CRP/FNR family transcriptional regulator, cyclic AMP receptor protein